jgi:hypothetical protein
MSKKEDGEEAGEAISKSFIRKVNFPARCQFLNFLSLACTNLFNPFMPNRSGYLNFADNI